MDLEILRFLAAPFVASLILTGIHAYLGVHVVERGVIFVDLSLAQIAALGSTIAMLLPFTGSDPHGPWVYWTGLAFTFIGAAIFSTVRVRHARIPQEAIIGIAYAVASVGLFVAREIMNAHGGRLTASSPGPGKGSTFRLTLPGAEALPEEEFSEYIDGRGTR